MHSTAKIANRRTFSLTARQYRSHLPKVQSHLLTTIKDATCDHKRPKSQLKKALKNNLEQIG